MTFTKENILQAVHLSLICSGRDIRVKRVCLENEDALCCYFYPASSKSMDVKLEIGVVMSVFNGLFRSGNLGVSFSHYVVRAMGSNDVELMYAISSKRTAELIGTGEAVDWLKSTVFVENTADYRLARAKQLISEIENGLRHAIKEVLSGSYGEGWWDAALGNSLGASVKETYKNQFGVEETKGEILIDYTYTIQLKKIITTHWPLFRHLFGAKPQLESLIDQLNVIRRNEAHNRDISEQELLDLASIHESLLANVFEIYSELSSQYLIENWRNKIKLVITGKVPPRDAKELIGYLGDMAHSLGSIPVPVQKRKLHSKMVSVVQDYKALQNELYEASVGGQGDRVNEINNAIRCQEGKMNEFMEEFLLSEA